MKHKFHAKDDIDFLLDAIPRERRAYFHIHVPKTAGVTMWKILKRNFKGHIGADYAPGGHSNQYSAETMAHIFYHWNYKCFSAHNYALDVIPFTRFKNLRAFSFVRDPVRKMVSCYQFLKSRPHISGWHITKAHDMGYIADSVKSTLLRNPMFFDCSQTDFIMGHEGAGLAEIQDYMERGVFHLFPMERFDDALLCMERLYPDGFSDCSYAKRENTAKSRWVPDDALSKRLELLPWVKADKALHRHAEVYLDRLLGDLYPSHELLTTARSEFKKRCAARRRLDIFLRLGLGGLPNKIMRKCFPVKN